MNEPIVQPLRVAWPRAGAWLHKVLIRDMDEIAEDPRVYDLTRRSSRLQVQWAQSECIANYASTGPFGIGALGAVHPLALEMWQFTAKCIGYPEVHAFYLVNAELSLPIAGEQPITFYRAAGFPDRGMARLHFDRLRTGIVPRLRA